MICHPERGLIFARKAQRSRPPVDAALLLTSPPATEAVVRDCVKAGIRRVWMHRASGKGAVSKEAVQFCREWGIQVIPGECPFMFFPNPGFHGIHGFIRKITGSYPRRAQASAA